MEWLNVILNDPRPEIPLTSIAIAALVVGPMVVEARARRFSVWDLKTLFLIFILVQFSVWPLMMYSMRSEQLLTFPITFWTSRLDDFVKGQYGVIAGLIAFYAGYRRAPVAYEKIVRHRWFDRLPTIPESGYQKLFWGCVAITGTAFAAMMASTGGVLYFVQNIDTLRTTAAEGWGVYLLPIQACHVGFVLYAAHAMARRESLLLPFAALLLQLVIGFVIGQRIMLIAPLAGFVLCYHRHVRPIRVTWRLATGILAFLAFNMWYTAFRGSGSVGLDAFSNVPVQVVLIAVFGRFHGAESLARIVDYTDHQGFHFGIPYVGDYLAQFVPRFLYPEKATIAYTENVTFFPEAFSGGETGSAVPSLMGEVYWAFGLVGIVLVLYLHGRLFRRIEEDSRRSSPVQTAIYWSFFVYALFVNETITFHFWVLSFHLLVLALIVSLIRSDRPERSAAISYAEGV